MKMSDADCGRGQRWASGFGNDGGDGLCPQGKLEVSVKLVNDVNMLEDDPTDCSVVVKYKDDDKGLLKACPPPPSVLLGCPWVGSSMSLGGGRYICSPFMLLLYKCAKMCWL